MPSLLSAKLKILIICKMQNDVPSFTLMSFLFFSFLIIRGNIVTREFSSKETALLSLQLNEQLVPCRYEWGGVGWLPGSREVT